MNSKVLSKKAAISNIVVKKVLGESTAKSNGAFTTFPQVVTKSTLRVTHRKINHCVILLLFPTQNYYQGHSEFIFVNHKKALSISIPVWPRGGYVL
jgi:hypothetical protein